jgi:putative transposase
MSFIDAHDFPAGLVLRVLGIAESTYYDWRARQVTPSRRELDDAALLEQIVKIRAAHEFAVTYGAPRVWLELRRQGVRVGRKRVERIMRTPRAAGRTPAAGLEARLNAAEPAPHRRAGPGRPRFPGRGPEPALGGRSDPVGHRRGRAVAGQRA